MQISSDIFGGVEVDGASVEAVEVDGASVEAVEVDGASGGAVEFDGLSDTLMVIAVDVSELVLPSETLVSLLSGELEFIVCLESEVRMLFLFVDIAEVVCTLVSIAVNVSERYYFIKF